jgi:hypothetical protein
VSAGLRRVPPEMRGPGPGERVLIWYDPADPADPADVLVHGRRRRLSDLVLLAVGVCFVAAGVVTGVLGP